MPQKHDNYTRKVLYGIGEGGEGGVVKAIQGLLTQSIKLHLKI
jgi:hypothetical protein